MWRILASLFGPETTPKRHQCVTVFAEKRRRNSDDGQKHQLSRRLSEARQCTEVTHGVHSRAERRGRRRNRSGLSLCGSLWPWPPAPGRASLARCRHPEAHCRNPSMPKEALGCHPGTQTIDLTRDECRSRLVDDRISCRGPMACRGHPSPLQSVAGRSFSTIRDPVKPRLTKPERARFSRDAGGRLD